MDNRKIPLVSFFVIAYNEEEYIREAVQGALNQDYPNMEIILSDDNSTDRTFEIMQEMSIKYKGPHRIILNQNKHNLGPRDHYCKILYDLCNGDYIVFSDGDDISLPNRTSFCVEFLENNPNVSALSLASQMINEKGEFLPVPWQYSMCAGKYSIFTLVDYINFDFFVFSDDSRVIRRSVIEAFPPLKYSYAEDVFLFIRSILVGSVAFIYEPLVLYRQHSSSIEGAKRARINTQKDIDDYYGTTAKQIREDFQYAIEKEYIQKKYVPYISTKLEKLISFLCPRLPYKNTILIKITRKVHRMFNSLFHNFEFFLEHI